MEAGEGGGGEGWRRERERQGIFRGESWRDRDVRDEVPTLFITKDRTLGVIEKTTEKARRKRRRRNVREGGEEEGVDRGKVQKMKGGGRWEGEEERK